MGDENDVAASAAESMSDNGEWALAAAYYEKAAYENPDIASDALEKKARCLINLNRFSEAATTLERISLHSVPADKRCTLLHEKALANHLAGNKENAATYLDEAFALDSLSGNMLLSSLIYNECFRFEDGLRCITNYLDENHAVSKAYEQVWALYSKPPHKHNENTATILSIVPGLGHFYSGAWKEGFLSMALNGITITLSATQAASGMYVTAILGCGMPLDYTYMGGTDRAISLVQERNLAKISEFNLKLISIL